MSHPVSKRDYLTHQLYIYLQDRGTCPRCRCQSFPWAQACWSQTLKWAPAVSRHKPSSQLSKGPFFPTSAEPFASCIPQTRRCNELSSGNLSCIPSRCLINSPQKAKGCHYLHWGCLNSEVKSEHMIILTGWCGNSTGTWSIILCDGSYKPWTPLTFKDFC